MARYTGPRVRISRRFGVPIFGPSKYLERRNYGPGVHGPKSRRKTTEYGEGLIEKQKLKYYYGLLERQFRGVYERALKRRGVTGEQMLQILETRLDNVSYHLGFANTRAAARQLVDAVDGFALGKTHLMIDRDTDVGKSPFRFSLRPDRQQLAKGGQQIDDGGHDSRQHHRHGFRAG